MSELVSLAHGGGGEEMQDLIQNLIFKILQNPILSSANDAAVFGLKASEYAFSTDSFVLSPIFFAGGDIGKIAACGTINDIAMMGAKPLYISCALMIEEGFSLNELERILLSLKQVCDEAGVSVVCGDTKVLPRGKVDKIFINTAGLGQVLSPNVGLGSLCDEAVILLSGDVGRHGAVVLASREEFDISLELKSDCARLDGVVASLIKAGVKPLAMRDATRGGLSAVLNEWSQASGLGVEINEASVVVSDEVRGICELFGFEPFELANEGTFVLAVNKNEADLALSILQSFNKNAAIIGHMSAKRAGVILKSIYGTQRFLEPPKGELLPRIC